MRLLFVVCSFVLFTTVAVAHSWYPWECCHDQDCEPVKLQHDEAGDFVVTKNGIRWNIRPNQIRKPSQDEDYHICTNSNGIICFFVPAGT